ncbi:MAG: FAD-binding oxidoreductase [Arenimonas sp.]|nr:FAD-binding oxidoreductase [Arenimonas sp.]
MEASDYYRTSAPAAVRYPSLSGRHQVDTCIVGAGFAGLNTALGLAERGVQGVCVLEADTVAYGASGRNGGFVFGGYSPGEGALLAGPAAAQAKSLYRGTQDAVDLIRRRIGQHGIACSHTDAGVLWANWFRDPAPLRERQALLAANFDTHWEWVPREQLAGMLKTSRYGDALFERNALHFNPLAYADGLAAAATKRGVGVHEHSPAVALERDGTGWRVRTAQGEVCARHVVLACGGYLAGLRRDVDAGVLPIATYVMVTEPLGARMDQVINTGAAVYDSRFAFDYYRRLPDTRLLWGGRISVRDRSSAAVERLLRRDLLQVYPQLEDVAIDYAWSGLMSYARHQMPQIGEVEPGLWVAQAFGGHGVAPTTFAGELLAAAIAEGDPHWRDFSGYGLVSALKPAGFLGAQLSYWWHQAKDAWKDRREQLTGP